MCLGFFSCHAFLCLRDNNIFGIMLLDSRGTLMLRCASVNEDEKKNLLVRQIDRWIASMERLRLSDYVRYVDDRKRMFWSNFWGGMARGVGMAVGFTILGALLVLILQDLARRNLPLIGDALAEIVRVVQRQME